MSIQLTVTVFAAVLLFAISCVCQPTFTCKNDIPYMIADPCNEIRTFASSYSRPYFDAIVQIAVKDSDGRYIVKAFGMAVAEKYFLTSVTSNFIKYGSSDLYIIYGGNYDRQIRSKDVQPQITIGVFNMAAWQDLALVKITIDFKFDKVIRINGNTSFPLHDRSFGLILITAGDKEYLMTTTNYYYDTTEPTKETKGCAERFEGDRFLTYDPNYMACGTGFGNQKLLIGSPLAQVLPNGDGVVLTGIRSQNSIVPDHHTTFLVTQVAPHCGWLSSVSNGDVECVNRNLV